MSGAAIVADLFAVLAVIAGFTMVFRQQRLRSWLRALRRDPGAPPEPPLRREEDPVHYILTIFGMMLLAFGLTIFGFVTTYALLT